MSEQELKALRVRIDSLDEKVLELISERARCMSCWCHSTTTGLT